MIDFQRKILGDAVRNRALLQALKKVIVPGVTTVADIGAGTGYLSFLALSLGAARCYLYEHSDALSLARKIAKKNGMEKKCHFVPFHSSEVENPVKVDLVISETLGNFATEEHLIENMEDAKRFLKKGGTLLPQKLRQYVVPIISPRALADIDIWQTIEGGLDFSPARNEALKNVYVEKVRTDDLLPGKDAVRLWDTIDFKAKNRSQRKAKVRWVLPHHATIYGFACFWECDLVPGITLSTSPFEKSTHWDQVVLPLADILTGKKGQMLTLEIAADTRHSIGFDVRWKANL